MKLGRIFYFLIALAVLFAPAGMPGDEMAMAMGHDMAVAAPMDHCAKQRMPDPDRPVESCCILVCFGLPSDTGRIDRMDAPAPAYQASALALFNGVPAETATPPPRAS